jgi:hypothetical protein
MKQNLIDGLNRGIDMAEKKTGGGSKLSRTQTVTVRFDPKLRYLAELAARKQRRTVSSFIEWAVEQSLHQIYLEDPSSYNVEGQTLSGNAEELWDVDDSERFIKLALFYPQLLTHEEQLVWRAIKDHGLLSKHNHIDIETDGPAKTLKFMAHEHLPFIQKHWGAFLAKAHGENVDIPEFEAIPF